MATNDFLPFATGSSANVYTGAEYAADADRTNGNQPGIAKSKLVNKAIRQSSIISSMVAQYIVDKTGGDALDDGTITQLLTDFEAAIDSQIGSTYQPKAPNYTGVMATIASAATTNIGAAPADYLNVTGTTTITAFDTVEAGIERTLKFEGALTLTHNATSLILPTGANITTVAGDTAVFRSEGGGNWRLVGGTIYTRVNTSSFGGDLSYKNTPISITSWSYSGATITLNVASHTFVANDYIEVSGLTATTFPPNGIWKVTSITSTTIVFTAVNTPTGTAGVSSASVKGYATVNGRTNGIGEGQTWQDVTASRALSTTYTNSTGNPIQVIISSYHNGINARITVIVDGTTIASYGDDGTLKQLYQSCSFIVKNGATYSIVASGTATIHKWAELR